MHRILATDDTVSTTAFSSKNFPARASKARNNQPITKSIMQVSRQRWERA